MYLQIFIGAFEMKMSSREFNQDVGRAKRESLVNPVIITERGKPSHVLINYDEYLKLKGFQPKIIDLLSLDNDIEFEPGKLSISPKHVDLD